MTKKDNKNSETKTASSGPRWKTEAEGRAYLRQLSEELDAAHRGIDAHTFNLCFKSGRCSSESQEFVDEGISFDPDRDKSESDE